jgi:prolyl oligopeptidase PreP (S9A serine peptidase family)
LLLPTTPKVVSLSQPTLQALKENRNKAYEDFIAVGEHLIETGICKPKTLATRGGSNGGLLMGNVSFMTNLSVLDS